MSRNTNLYLRDKKKRVKHPHVETEDEYRERLSRKLENDKQ